MTFLLSMVLILLQGIFPSTCDEKKKNCRSIDFSVEKNTFSWRRIELCVKYLHSHGHRKIFVVLPYTMKYHRYESEFTESKSLRKLERKHHIIYTNRLFKRTNQHLNELLKFTAKNQGFLISNVSLKEIITNVTIYKQTMEEKIVRYQFENER